ncbi:MAG: hypothetical protein IJV56_08550, partial [Neisseriaceae bacterium]|nr:hypothetical protein [Neisseriaceae bacterium]
GFGRVRARFCGQNLAAKQPYLLFDSPLIKGFRQPDGCVCSVFFRVKIWFFSYPLKAFYREENHHGIFGLPEWIAFFHSCSGVEQFFRQQIQVVKGD